MDHHSSGCRMHSHTIEIVPRSGAYLIVDLTHLHHVFATTSTPHTYTQCRPPSSPFLTPHSSSRMTVSRSLYAPPSPSRLNHKPFAAHRTNASRISTNARKSSQADKLQSLISAAKVTDVEPIWTTLFAKARSEGCILAGLPTNGWL